MEKELRTLKLDEVISATGQKFIKGLQTFTVDESLTTLRSIVPGQEYTNWFTEGVDCKVLTPGGYWQTGKVKISLAFCPDKVDTDESTTETEVGEETVEYPLDEIRRSLNSGETP